MDLVVDNVQRRANSIREAYFLYHGGSSVSANNLFGRLSLQVAYSIGSAQLAESSSVARGESIFYLL